MVAGQHDGPAVIDGGAQGVEEAFAQRLGAPGAPGGGLVTGQGVVDAVEDRGDQAVLALGQDPLQLVFAALLYGVILWS